MKCPRCGHPKTFTTTTHRPAELGAVRRRKQCQKCRRTFTTVEIRVGDQEPTVQITEAVTVGRARNGRNLTSGRKLTPVDNAEG